MWKFLQESYGCRPVIAIKYFKQSAEGILPSIYRDVTSSMRKQDDLGLYQDSLISEHGLKNLNDNQFQDSNSQMPRV